MLSISYVWCTSKLGKAKGTKQMLSKSIGTKLSPTTCKVSMAAQTMVIIKSHYSSSFSPLFTSKPNKVGSQRLSLSLVVRKDEICWSNLTKESPKDTIKGGSGGETAKLGQLVVPTMMVLLIALIPRPSLAIEAVGGGALFRRACIGCHDAGGNLIQPGATLFAKDLERNGVDSEEDIYKITYSGKGRMPGFGEKCTPRGQCTFGPRLQDEEIRLLAQFVKSQSDQAWPAIQ